MFTNKKVLVAGGTGLIGIQLVSLLLERGARVRVVSLDRPERVPPGAEFYRRDLTDFRACMEVCEGTDYVFNLVCIKGSPAITTKRPASFFVPMVQCYTNLAEAARRARVKWYLYASSVAVYAPAPLMKEETFWETSPSPNDRFPGWAKRIGEMQLEAYRIEYNQDNFSIVRPGNIYGPYDNFHPKNSQVIPSLIQRISKGEDPLVVWGNGSNIRDFMHARDCARAMLFTVENRIAEPINVASGNGITIRQLVETILRYTDRKPKVFWDTDKPSGDKMRLLDVTRLNRLGFRSEVSLEEGIREVIEWYRQNKNNLDVGYNIFAENPPDGANL